MKYLRIFLAVFLLFIFSCSEHENNPVNDQNYTYSQPEQFPRADENAPDPENEDSGIIVPEDQLIAFTQKAVRGEYQFQKPYWAMPTHQDIVYIAALKLGLPEHRAAIMRDAAHMPDIFQAGIQNFYNQQWSHAYVYWVTWFGSFWVWGDADDDFHDNLFGDSGEWESPEGYNGKWAGYYYTRGMQDLGDWYTGYACHYIEDVSLYLHTTIPDVDMAVHHIDYEEWINDNWTAGHHFRDAVLEVSASEFHNFSDAKAAIRHAAKNANYFHNYHAREAWNNYVRSGFPRGAGTGNSALVYHTRFLLKEAIRNAGGAIKLSLDYYHQW